MTGHQHREQRVGSCSPVFGKRFGDGFHVRLGSDEDGNRRHRFILGADLIFDLEDPLSNPGDNVFILEIFP